MRSMEATATACVPLSKLHLRCPWDEEMELTWANLGMRLNTASQKREGQSRIRDKGQSALYPGTEVFSASLTPLLLTSLMVYQHK